MGKGATSNPKTLSGKSDKSKKGKKATHKLTAKWSLKNEKNLVKFLVHQKAKAGDGGNFKIAVFKEAPVYLAAWPYEGPEKMAVLKKDYWAVCKLKKASGFSYSDKDGAGITADTKSVWDTFILPFKNKGWPHYNHMAEMMPVKAKSENVFHPAQGSGGLEGEVEVSLSSLEEESDEDEDDEVDQLDGLEDIEISEEEDGKLSNNEDSSSDEDLSELEAVLTMHLATPMASQKRKSSAISKSTTKKPRLSRGAAVLKDVEGQLSSLNGLLHTMLAAETTSIAPVASIVPLTPQQKQLAIQWAQQLEQHLEDDKMILLLNLFEKDVGAADAYLCEFQMGGMVGGQDKAFIH
ncbi:hypothetical protein V8D89_016177 [Ganoderma adspersum]